MSCQEPCPNCRGRPPLCLACHRKRVAEAQQRRRPKPAQVAKRDWQKPLDDDLPPRMMDDH